MEDYATLSYVVAYWALSAVILGLYRRYDRSDDALNPLFVNTIILFIYSLGGGMFVDRGEVAWELGPISRDVLVEFYAICLVGVACYQLGFVFQMRRALRRRSRAAVADTDAIDRRMLLLAGILMGVAFFPTIKGHVIPFMGERYSSLVPRMLENGMDDTSANFSLYLTERFPLTLVLAAATLAALGMRAKLARWAGSAVLLGALASSAIIGLRQAMMFALAIPAVYFHYRVRRYSKLLLVTGGLTIYFLIAALQYIRYMDLEAGIKEFAAIVQERPEVLTPMMSGEANGPTIFFMAVIEDTRAGVWGPQYARPLLDAVWSFLPRVIAERPLPALDEYLWLRSPDIIARGGGFGCFAIQDPYFSFGWVGVPSIMFLAGAAVAKLYHYFVHLRARHDVSTLAYSVVFYNVAIQFARCTLYGLPKYLLMATLPFLILMGARMLITSGWRRPARQLSRSPGVAFPRIPGGVRA